MPTRAPTACSKPGCPGLVTNGTCSVCGPTRRSTDAAYDTERGSASSRGYTARWRRIRAIKLSMNPICEYCEREGVTTPAVDVDHIIPKREGGSDALYNLQSLCKQHHSQKTRSGR